MKLDTSGLFSWTIKLIIIIFVFGVFPAMVVVIAKNYDEKANSIAEVQKALIKQQEDFLDKKNNVVGADSVAGASINNTSGAGGINNEYKILTAEQADSLQKINSFISGNWKSKDDDLKSFSINPNGNYDEYYSDKKVSYGLWSSNVGTSTYFFIRKPLGSKSSRVRREIQLSRIELLDENNLIIVNINNSDGGDGIRESFYKLF